MQHLNPFRKLKRFLYYKLKKKINIDLDKKIENLSIDDLFQYFSCDKAKKWENGTGHGFSVFYERHLASYKNKKINILEVGSFTGASAATFVKFFPLSKVYCLDINLTNFKYSSRNIEVFALDISEKKMLNKFYKSINISKDTQYFDIIIDDGSHKLSDIVVALNSLYKNLKSGGLYVIEDFKYPNYYKHLNDCTELKVDQILDCLKNKKKFKSNILTQENIDYISNSIEEISDYRGQCKDSDIAFIKRLY